MPLLTVYTTESSPPNPNSLLKSLSGLLAKELGKPESYVMTALVPDTSMTFGGTTEPACYAELKSLGEFSKDATARLSRVLCTALAEGLRVPQNRIYIEFTNPPGHLWGHDGETFA
jgi:phenylpyruvate tautomerase PptA (4-oxalocrotonate tautomerase family)